MELITTNSCFYLSIFVFQYFCHFQKLSFSRLIIFNLFPYYSEQVLTSVTSPFMRNFIKKDIQRYKDTLFSKYSLI